MILRGGMDTLSVNQDGIVVAVGHGSSSHNGQCSGEKSIMNPSRISSKSQCLKDLWFYNFQFWILRNYLSEVACFNNAVEKVEGFYLP